MLTLRQIECELTGISPLLFNKKDNTIDVKLMNPEEIAVRHLHRTESNGRHPFVPAEMLLRSIRAGGVWVKYKRGTMKKQLDAMLTVEPLEIMIEPAKWVTDHRIGYNRNGGLPIAIDTYRPRFDVWKLNNIILTWDASLCDDVILRQCCDSAAYRVGLGSYSPRTGGMFGRYQVTKWKVRK